MTARGPVTDWTATTLLAERDWLRSLATRLVRDEAERDDLVQEACLAALRRPATEALDPRRWLNAVLRNRWRFARRTDARRRERELARVDVRHAPSAAELAEQAELQRVLVGAVLALDEPYRSTVLLRYFGDLSARAIAKREGVPEGTVRSRLKRALDQLREELDRENGERRVWVLALVPLMRREPVSASVAAATAGLVALVLGGLWWRSARAAQLDAAAVPTESVAGLDAQAASAPTKGGRIDREGVPAAPHGTEALVRAGLELLVLDPESQPIPGASVTARGDVAFDVVADADGVCSLPLVGWRSDYLPLRVDAPGFVHVDSTLDRGGFSWSSPYVVYLPRSVELEGRLLDAETRTPIAHAELLLVLQSDERPADRSQSGADGAFRLRGAPQGWEVQVEVRARDHVVQRRRIQVPNGAGVPLELAVERGDELHGRAVDALTHLPIAGVQVYREENGFRDAPSESAALLATSDATGGLVLRLGEEVQPGDVLVTAVGYGAVRLRPRTDGFEIPLVATATVEGVLRDVAGRPYEGSTVMIAPHGFGEEPGPRILEAVGSELLVEPNARYLAPRANVTTDDQGRFRIEGAFAGVATRLLVFASRMEHPIAPPLQPREVRRIDLTAPRHGTESITGLLRINGEPAPGRVQCRWPGGGTDTWSGPDGVFEIHGVPSGAVELTAWPDEYVRMLARPPDTKPTRLDVIAGQIAHVELDLVLELGTIAGRVTTFAGEPRPRVSVVASARGASWRGLTGDDGRFELRVPADGGTYQVAVQGAEPVQAGVNGEELVIATRTSARLRLRVVDAATGAVVDRATLFVRPLGRAWDWKGEFSVDPAGLVEFVLDPGRLDITVGKVDDGYPPVLVSGLLLTEDDERELTVELEKVPAVQFRLANPPLPSPCWVRIEGTSADPTFALRDMGGGSSVDVHFADGVAELLAIPAGRYRLVASSNRKPIPLDPPEIEIGADRSQPIEIRWQRADAR